MKRRLRELWELWPLAAFALLVLVMVGPVTSFLRLVWWLRP